MQPFLPQGHYLNKLDRGTFDYATGSSYCGFRNKFDYATTDSLNKPT